jgi:hypothetical protein
MEYLPSSGPTVLLNVSARCDAIAFVPGLSKLVHIPLENFNDIQAMKLQDRLKCAVTESQSPRRANTTLLAGDGDRTIRPAGEESPSQSLASILRDLWVLIVKPVIARLALLVSVPTQLLWI